MEKMKMRKITAKEAHKYMEENGLERNDEMKYFAINEEIDAILCFRTKKERDEFTKAYK